MYRYLIFDTGHNALSYIIKKYGIEEMNIPYYLCDIIRHTLVKEGCKPVFYHIDDYFYPEKEFSDNDYILYPNYWGICRENVNILINKYPKMIIDNAHAFFDTPCGFACFNAGHKFGYKESYAFIQDSSENTLPDMSNEPEAIIRYNIFKELHERYKNTNTIKLNFNNKDISPKPFVYPYLASSIKEADNLVKELKKEGKIVYRYWSPLPKSFNEYKFYSRLVPIPILPH